MIMLWSSPALHGNTQAYSQDSSYIVVPEPIQSVSNPVIFGAGLGLLSTDAVGN